MIDLDKIQPQATEIEEALLGALFIQDSKIFDVVKIIKPEYFCNDCNKLIYEAILKIHNSGSRFDPVSVTHELRNAGRLDNVGGASYLTKLMMSCSTAAQIEKNAYIVKEMYLRREYIRLHSDMNTKFYDCHELLDDILADQESRLCEINDQIMSSADGRGMNELAVECMQNLDERERKYFKNETIGIPTGLCDLDKALTGWLPGRLYIIAARPSIGKTALALHHYKTAGLAGYGCLFFSLEMSDVSLADRLILSETNVDANKYRSGFIGHGEKEQCLIASDRLSAISGRIIDKPMNIERIKTYSRAYAHRYALDIIFVDYLQLIRRPAQKGRSTSDEIGDITKGLKELSKELKVPVVLLCQLNRECEERKDKKPQLSDLRSSGEIEQDADVVIMIYRPAFYGILDINEPQNTGQLLIVKQRDGMTGSVLFQHNESITKFFDSNINF